MFWLNIDNFFVYTLLSKGLCYAMICYRKLFVALYDDSQAELQKVLSRQMLHICDESQAELLRVLSGQIIAYL